MAEFELVMRGGHCEVITMDGEPLKDVVKVEVQADGKGGLPNVKLEILAHELHVNLDDCEVDGLPTRESLVDLAHDNLNEILDTFIAKARRRAVFVNVDASDSFAAFAVAAKVNPDA